MEVDMEYSHVNVEWNVNGNGNDDLELCRYKIPEINLFRSLSLSLFLAVFLAGMYFIGNLRILLCCVKMDKVIYSDFLSVCVKVDICTGSYLTELTIVKSVK